MKKVYIFFLMLATLQVTAQQADSVLSGGNDVFYNLNTGDETVVNKESWDIGFTTTGFDASIITNETKGLKLYVYSNDTTQWNSVDTSGFNFETNQLYNSDENWENGAFANLNVNFPDYGWGEYNSDNHYLNGTRLFLLEMTDGTIYQIHIVQLTSGGVFTVKIGSLGGANTTYTQIAKGDYDTKNFVYFDVANRSIADLEPSKDSWQLLFTKYNTEIQPGVYYPVSGVKVNKGLMVAERTGVAVTNNDTNGLFWTDNITEIGYDWKTFNNSTFQYEITSDLSYFVKNEKGDVWKIWFTDYSGGNYYFNVEKIAHNASVKRFELLNARVYPTPARDHITIENSEAELAEINIYTLEGQLLMSTEIGALEMQDMSVADMVPGFYIIRISSKNKQLVQRIIIE